MKATDQQWESSFRRAGIPRRYWDKSESLSNRVDSVAPSLRMFWEDYATHVNLPSGILSIIGVTPACVDGFYLLARAFILARHNVAIFDQLDFISPQNPEDLTHPPSFAVNTVADCPVVFVKGLCQQDRAAITSGERVRIERALSRVIDSGKLVVLLSEQDPIAENSSTSQLFRTTLLSSIILTVSDVSSQ